MRVLGAALVLAASRVAVLAGHELAWTWWTPIAYLWQDAATLLAYAAIDRGLRRAPRLAWTVYAIFALYVAATVPAARVMATPMTWTMWRAAGGAIGDSIGLYATAANITWAAAVGAAAAVPFMVRGSPFSVPVRRSPFGAALGMLALCVAAGPAARRHVDTRGLDRNAWSALAIGTFPRVSAAAASGDWRAPRADDGGATRPASGDRTAALAGAAAGRNVVLVSLESTAAQYLGLYGAQPDVAPNLTALAARALVFNRAYAVYPESIKGLHSMLCSTWPPFDRPAEIYAAAPCRPLAAELAARGYRTALFHSGRFGYLGMDAVIRGRGFEVLADAGDIGGRRESSFGVDDGATVERLLAWIDGLPRGDRFFATYLPIAGHHPYEAAAPGPFPGLDEFGRYRNALHGGDAVLGELVRGLEARGHGNDTLWVIIGDHGEAFGQHGGNFGHTFQLYEENVRVPFILAAPGLLASQQRPGTIVSLIDIAPTILDLLGLPVPGAYAGRSALTPGPRMALFFADYSLGLLGLRDGSRKYIYEIESGRSRLFDLERDPLEEHDIAARDPERAAWYRDRLRAWIAAH